MQIKIQLTHDTITRPEPVTAGGSVGAWVEFVGRVRGEEDGRPIAALEYEAYDAMAERVIHELLEQLGARNGCISAHVIHRLGLVPVGEAAIWMGVGSRHRAAALALVGEFMDRLKQDVPIWKRRPLTQQEFSQTTGEGEGTRQTHRQSNA